MPLESSPLEKTGLIDFSSHGKIRLTGSDRISFLHQILTNDIEALQPGQGCHAALLTAQGRILLDMFVYVFPDSVLIETETGYDSKLVSLLERYLITEDVQIENVTSDYGFFLLDGPSSKNILSHAGIKIETLKKDYDFLETPFEKNQIVVIKRNLLSQHGFQILISKKAAQYFINILLASNDVTLIDDEGYEAMRIEAGVLRYGKDMDETIMLPETGLEATVASETKGCYPGQEVVARIKTYGGLKKKITKLEFDADSKLKAGDKIYKDGKEIGWVTSVSPFCMFHKKLSLCYIMRS